ncbi:MAG: complex I subunit 1 family protein [Fibrobacterota bacterium]
MAHSLFYIFVFPGFLFLLVFSLFAEWVDRKLYARFQNRMGPPWFQPLADMIKLFGKECIIPDQVEARVFKVLPLVALAATVTSFLYIPLWGTQALFSFEGDVIVVLYLLTIPTLTFFMAGWFSLCPFSLLGATRCLTQLFAYEVPLFVCILSSALLADTWSLSGIAAFYAAHPGYWLFNLIGFAIGIFALLGKLEKAPLDIPEAETEIVAGTFTEYSGNLFAFFRMAINIEMIVGASLLAAVFLPFGLSLGPVAGFAFYILKVLLVVAFLSLAHAVFARIRIDQMINLCWKYVAPLGFAQLLINIILKGALA